MADETKDVTSDSSTDKTTGKAAAEKKEAATEDVDAAESDTSEDGDDDSKLPFNKHPRWRKIHGELKEYKDIKLSPKELKAALAKLNDFETAAAEAETESDEDEPSAEEKALAKQRKLARKELLKIYPELEELTAVKQRVDLFGKALEYQANEALTEVLAEAGLPTDEANAKAMEEVLATIIQDDKKLFMQYVANPEKAVKEAFKRFGTGFKTAAERSVKADLQAKKLKLLGLPKAHKGGMAETSTKKDDKGPKNLNEARKRAEERLRALED